jgi:hypothetical protein
MNRVKVVAAVAVAWVVAGCAEAPSWNESQFPPQPEYGASSGHVGAVEAYASSGE